MPDDDPWESRYGQSETAETEEASEASKTSKSEETTETEKTSVKDRKNVNMYLPEELVSDLQLRYSELNLQWRREYDEDMPKNDHFYPAVIRAALEETSVEEQLPVDD